MLIISLRIDRTEKGGSRCEEVESLRDHKRQMQMDIEDAARGLAPTWCLLSCRPTGRRQLLCGRLVVADTWGQH